MGMKSNTLLQLVSEHCVGKSKPAFIAKYKQDGEVAYKPANRKAMRLLMSKRFSNIMDKNGLELNEQLLVVNKEN